MQCAKEWKALEFGKLSRWETCTNGGADVVRNGRKTLISCWTSRTDLVPRGDNDKSINKAYLQGLGRAEADSEQEISDPRETNKGVFVLDDWCTV